MQHYPFTRLTPASTQARWLHHEGGEMIESYNAIINNLQRMIDEAENSIAAMDAGNFKLFRIEDGKQIDETDLIIKKDRLNIVELKVLVKVIEDKRDNG